MDDLEDIDDCETISTKQNVINCKGDTIGVNDVPRVCKIEEVSTEEESIHDPDSDNEYNLDQDENEPSNEDTNTSVLATLAELAQATSEGEEGATLEMSSSDALELLKAQAALLPADDGSTLISTAIAHGQTIQLTEAGQQALKMIKQDPLLLPKPRKNINLRTNSDEENRDIEKSTRDTSNSKILSSKSTFSKIKDKEVSVSLNPTSTPTSDDVNDQFTQVITVTPEQYASLTSKSFIII